jgi:hypothetical protein
MKITVYKSIKEWANLSDEHGTIGTVAALVED